LFKFLGAVSDLTAVYPYPYWDTLSSRGLVYPSTDNFALVICLGEVIVPLFIEEKVNWNPSYLLHIQNYNYFQARAIIKHVVDTIEKIGDSDLKPLTEIFGKVNHDLTDIDGNVNYSPLQLINTIQDFAKTHAKAFALDTLIKLENLNKEIIVITDTLKLIYEVVEKDKNLNIFLKDNPEEMDRCIHDTRHNPQVFYENSLLKIFESSSAIKKRIEALQKELQ
jgi:hypothetical protein